MAETTSDLRHVIGIGASAGGLEALQELIVSLPAQLPNTAIVIAQHLSPDYKSMLVELLGRKTKIPIQHIDRGLKLESNNIYIAPPSDDVSVDGEKFSLKEPVTAGAHPSVDVLFSSLAKEYGSKAGGVILSGTGKDGSRGIVAIHAAGGVTIVQDPATAKYDGMPQASVHTGLVEHVLAPGKIGESLLELINNPQQPVPVEQTDEPPQETFPQIFELLEHRIGIDFSDYKISTLVRRLNKRIHERHFTTEDEYLRYVRENPEELDRLFETLLIGVTTFFRDREIVPQVQKAIRAIIGAKKSGEVVRVWVPGCASGEEAYTLAILICEELSASGKSLPLQFFATDLDVKALQRARLGVYPSDAIRHVPKDILNKYFKKLSDDSYEVHKDIRKLVLFSRHDVTANPPFLRVDLLSCRNLLIYFNTELQKKVLPLFYYALNPQGFMLLGKSENIGKFQNLFSPYSLSDKLFQRKASDGKLIKFPQLRPHRGNEVMRSTPTYQRQDLTIAEMVKETLFHQYGHPFVVVDDGMDIVEINGDLSPFLELKTGGATLNINKLIIRPLQIELRAVTTKAVATMKPAFGNLRKLEGDPPHYVRINAKPLEHGQANNPYFFISFETVDIDEKLMRMGAAIDEAIESPRVIELEHELDATKEHMNSLLEELETSNEELQALNEEMQASNEELQASNEELETSNEELQATNEELENAYTELREANREIGRQKSELERSAENLATLLNNTLVGIIMIDREYKIMSVNKTAKMVYRQLFGVKLEEHVSHLKLIPGDALPAFHKHFRDALEGRQVVTEEAFKEKDDGSVRYFDINYTPVALSKEEDEARYVVVSFVDITKRKQAELDIQAALEELDAEKRFMNTLTGNLPCLIWTTDSKGSYAYCNDYLLDYVGKTFKQMKKDGWQSIIHPDDWEATERLWDSSLESGETLRVEHRVRQRSGKYRWHLTVVEVVRNAQHDVRMWVGSSVEIEELLRRREMEQQVELLENQRKSLVRLNRSKDEFISLASHQLRTPATAVKQYLGLLMDEYAGPLAESQMTYLKTAYSSNERQLTTINDLLKTARLDASDLTLTKKKQSFSKLLREAQEEMKPMTDLKNQLIKISNKGSIDANIDYGEVKLAVLNLIENASKYSYPGTTIEVTLRKTSKHVVLSVRDYGVGIPEDQQQKIFEKLTRVDNELSDTVSGSGLGLYWVKRIVELHDGTISVESAPRKGSTFRIELPV